MRAIVLVKQVPDVRVGSVGTKPDGTIDRSNAAAITNPSDLHAVEAGLQIADEVIAVSMGPSRAADSLREVVALGGSRGVLLTDRLFAGSDTWATANALSAAIRRLGGADLILSGLTALDGETGHVGPQVAERLGLPLVTGCEALVLEGRRLTARRVIEGGYETVAVSLPAVVTVSETGFTPRYPTLPGRLKGERAEIEVLSAADLGLDASVVGLEASPTKVAHMEMVPLPKTECRFLDADFGYPDLVGELLTSDPARKGDAPEAGGSAPPPAPSSTSGYGVWVVGETQGEELSSVTTELLSKAVDLATVLGTGVAALLVGHGLSTAAGQAAGYGADLVLTAEDQRLVDGSGAATAKVLVDAIRERSPDVVLFGATTSGRALAPRVAATLDTGVAADCTALYIGDWERRDHVYTDLLHQVRPAMAGGVLATCICPVARPQIATVRPGVFAPLPARRELRIEPITVSLTDADFDVEVVERAVEWGDVALADADVIVAGGAGCNADNWHLIEDLAGNIGGRVAASRAAVEAGLAPRSRQVGQTGATVRPRLYIACGISGALQHVVGMRASSVVVAINRDPDAAIFRFADFGIVGDVAEVLPALTEAFALSRP